MVVLCYSLITNNRHFKPAKCVGIWVKSFKNGKFTYCRLCGITHYAALQVMLYYRLCGIVDYVVLQVMCIAGDAVLLVLCNCRFWASIDPSDCSIVQTYIKITSDMY